MINKKCKSCGVKCSRSEEVPEGEYTELATFKDTQLNYPKRLFKFFWKHKFSPRAWKFYPVSEKGILINKKNIK